MGNFCFRFHSYDTGQPGKLRFNKDTYSIEISIKLNDDNTIVYLSLIFFLYIYIYIYRYI